MNKNKVTNIIINKPRSEIQDLRFNFNYVYLKTKPKIF